MGWESMVVTRRLLRESAGQLLFVSRYVHSSEDVALDAISGQVGTIPGTKTEGKQFIQNAAAVQ